MRNGSGKKKPASLIVTILCSAIVFTIVGIIGRFTIYKDYEINLWKTPFMVLIIDGMKDGIYPWDMLTYRNDKNQGENDVATVMGDQLGGVDIGETSDITMNGSEGESPMQAPSKAPSESTGEVELGVATDPTETVSNELEEPNSENSTSNPSQSVTKAPIKEQTTEEEATIGTVTQDYFDDALFIGDSRTVGLSEYSYLKNATYYADVGLSIYSVFQNKIAKLDHKSVTLEEALSQQFFAKIYIMLGINELGTGTAKTFAAKYQTVIDRILELQPEASVVIQAIMNVGQKKSETDAIFNNNNIRERNEELKKLANNETIFYIDVNEALTDENGDIPEDYTFDSIHLKGKYYNEWADFLLEHGIIKESFTSKE